MTPEAQLGLTRTAFYGFSYFMLLDVYVSYLTHLGDGAEGMSFLNLDVFNPKPETYNTLALITAFIGASAAVWNVGRLRNKIEGK